MTLSAKLKPCPDCKGSGKYVGFTLVESCKACRGTGYCLPRRVDVIKPSETQNRLFRMMLTRQGYRVRTFRHIFDWLATLDSSPEELPHCLIVGYASPESGIEAAKLELALRGIEVPLIVCTGSEVAPDDRPDGVFAWFSGSWFGDDFFDAVRRAVR